jgi:peptidoglycan/xylan/chitin deacetylase (PgdA/CDA1 family)
MRAVLCYHKVGDEREVGRWIAVSPTGLRDQVSFFLRRGYKVVRPEEIVVAGQDRVIALTFDDAFESMLVNGLPVLKELGVPATIYAIGDLVGHRAEWEGMHGEQLASWDMLREAQSAGLEIGNHSATHADFGRLDYDQQVAEIRRCDERLRAEGLEPRTLCLPFGRYGRETSKAIEEAGYGIGFTVEKRWVSRRDDPRLLPRFAMSYGDGVLTILYKMFVRPRISGSRRGTR